MDATEEPALKHIDDLERLELQEPSRFREQQNVELLTLYLFTNQLEYARLLWRRTSYKSNQIMARLNDICQSVAKRDWVRVHAALSINWPDNILNLMTGLKEKIREGILHIIQQAYTSIPLIDVSQLLSIPSAELSLMLTNRGWAVDAATEMVVTPTRSGALNDSVAGDSTLELARLTRIISYVENQ